MVSQPRHRLLRHTKCVDPMYSALALVISVDARATSVRAIKLARLFITNPVAMISSAITGYLAPV